MVTQQDITKIVSRLVIEANNILPGDVQGALLAGMMEESDPTARTILSILQENSVIAAQSGLPICQDTGIDVVFLEIGQELSIDGDIKAAVNAGISKGTREGYLRSSVCDPLTRKNSGDNTPAQVHLDLVPGNSVKITILPKGCGSENMSALFMLPPSAGTQGIVDAVVDQVVKAGPNPCPPGIIGVGIGGTMEMAALLSKKALLRPVGQASLREDVAFLEQEMLARINHTGIGPQGLGGSTTTFAVHVETEACHIASLPVAVNLQCHAARLATAIFKEGRWQVLSREGVSRPEIGRSSLAWEESALRVELPITEEEAAKLTAGQRVLLSGPLYTGRDQTHKRLIELLDAGRELPVDLTGQLLYYVGPSPAPPGRVVGSAGPTTSYRMDAYTPRLLEKGLAATMGKGRRSLEVRQAMARHGAIYFATIGGAGAYLSEKIVSCNLVAFEDLGPEAMFRMEVRNFPAVVINDAKGNDWYEEVRKRS